MEIFVHLKQDNLLSRYVCQQICNGEQANNILWSEIIANTFTQKLFLLNNYERLITLLFLVDSSYLRNYNYLQVFIV